MGLIIYIRKKNGFFSLRTPFNAVYKAFDTRKRTKNT